jgi:exonuclease SbcC
MRPQQITLTNFLSYRQAQLDFTGLHVACIAGANGAGKSSLLEAISWSVWGQSRVASDHDVIHQGAEEARVSFVFQQGEQIYRIIRRRHRLQGTGLEFQIKTEAGYRALTQGTVRQTQRLICSQLKLDYDTFINSAYLRQGRADDFMLKRPAERQEILATLLKLDRYEALAEAAREQARQARVEVGLRQKQLADLQVVLAEQGVGEARLTDLKQQLQVLEQAQQQTQAQLGEGQRLQQQLQQLQLGQQRAEHLQRRCDETSQALAKVEADWRSCQATLAEGTAIATGLEQLAALEQQDEQLNQRFSQYQTWQQQRQQLGIAYGQQRQTLERQQQSCQAELEAVEQQLQEILRTLNQTAEVDQARQQLAVAKARLKHLDALQLQTGPLLQRQRQLETQLTQEETRLQSRLAHLQLTVQQLQAGQNQQPQLVASAQALSQTLSYLERRQAYQEQVQAKGLERRRFVETLQANQRRCQTEIAQVGQKLQLLGQPQAACPLCDRPLDHHHRTLVVDRHQLEQQELQEQIWVIGEQLAVSEREMQVLRQEYRAVEAELAAYAPALQRQGQLEAQIASQLTVQQQLQQLEQEIWQLQQCLEQGHYGADQQTELRQIQHTLKQLAYDDRDHALVRGQVNRLRWADLKHHELSQARRRQRRLQQQRQRLSDRLASLEEEGAQLDQSPLKQSLDQVEAALQDLGYDLGNHSQVRQALQAAQVWRRRQQELDWAQQQAPLLEGQRQTLEQQRRRLEEERREITAELETLAASLDQAGLSPAHLIRLETEAQQQQQQREVLLAQLGALTQTCQHLAEQQQQYQQQQRELGAVQQRQRVYQTLAQAFGRRGIPAMMMENALPQLEAETNRLLGRLSDHQMHVRFVTQRPKKLDQQTSIDTLDILIADAQGTRPYETYSGGEAFRVNFALRLALARLLAQQSGLPLELLIIDEGFASQDEAGCDRLIAAINAIASDFACILTVTHLPHFREAFPARIDVVKTEQGSQLAFSL